MPADPQTVPAPPLAKQRAFVERQVERGWKMHSHQFLFNAPTVVPVSKSFTASIAAAVAASL